jgi:hypothetical protein
MIKTALKHYIYEFSLDVFFNKLNQNFNISVTSDLPQTGDVYKKISHIYGDEHYHNCIVKNVEIRGSDSEPYAVVYANYEYSTGSDVDELLYNEQYEPDEFHEYEYDDDIIIIDENQTIGDLIDSEDLEFFEGDGVIALNSKYYTFIK